jgi:hypothetical protein
MLLMKRQRDFTPPCERELPNLAPQGLQIVFDAKDLSLFKGLWGAYVHSKFLF